MGYVERITWSGLITAVAVIAVYIAIVAPQLARVPVERIDWAWPMVWVIAGGIAGTILISIVWGIVAGIRDPDIEHRSDQRDKEIEWFGDRVSIAFMIIGALVGLVLAMLQVHRFWIGQAIFLGFFLTSFVGGIARIVAYRRGLP